MALEFVALGAGDYDRAKRVLNRARHPGFVGREFFFRCATTGAAVVAAEGAADLGVALVAKGKLGALSVVPEARGRGVASALVAHTAPRFVSAIEDRVSMFERLGYRRVGAAAPGRNGKLAVQLMELAGEIQATGEVRAAAPRVPPAASEKILVQPNPAFMALYLDRVLGPVKELKIDLSDAPDEVVEYLAEKLN